MNEWIVALAPTDIGRCTRMHMRDVPGVRLLLLPGCSAHAWTPMSLSGTSPTFSFRAMPIASPPEIAEAPILQPSDGEELTHWKRPWCWERLKAGGEGDDRGWDGWMASLTWWMWVWVSSESWWMTGQPGVLQSMGSQRVGHDCVTELNWDSSMGTRTLDWQRYLLFKACSTT